MVYQIYFLRLLSAIIDYSHVSFSGLLAAPFPKLVAL